MIGKAWLGVAALLIACAGKSEDAGGMGSGADSLSACDPLAAETTSVRFDAAQVVAAGRGGDGTLYVIYGVNRLFVGKGDALRERVVTGSGQTGTQLDLDYRDDDGTFVTVELSLDASDGQMSVARGMQSSKGIDPGQGETLTRVEASAVAELAGSTTRTFELDFVASLADGRELVVVAPSHAEGYDEFRVFLGPSSALAQRVVNHFGSSQSGQRFATLTVDGADADLTYLSGGASELNPNGGPSTLTIAGTEYALSEGPLPAKSAYLCRASALE